MKIFIVIAVSTTDVCRFVGKLSKEGLPRVLIRTKKDIFKFECPYKERRTKKDAVAGLLIISDHETFSGNICYKIMSKNCQI